MPPAPPTGCGREPFTDPNSLAVHGGRTPRSIPEERQGKHRVAEEIRQPGKGWVDVNIWKGMQELSAAERCQAAFSLQRSIESKNLSALSI